MSTDTSSIEDRLADERLSRLRPFVMTVGIAWSVFSLEYLWSGCGVGSLLCAMPAIASSFLYPLTLDGPRKVIAHVYLAMNCLALVSISLVTGQSESYATLFLCCFGVFASHMLGIRASMWWSVACMSLLTLINSDWLNDSFPNLHPHTTWDKTTHSLGVAALLFFFNRQAQHYFQVQTTELEKMAESLSEKASAFEELAQFDTLTGLFNRHSFQRQIQISLLEARKSKTTIALMVLDLDGFKEINDTLGHQTGDAILQSVAHRLKGQVHGEHLVSRLGGDEFTVIVEQAETRQHVRQLAEDVATRLSMPYQIGEKEYSLGVSVGVAFFPDHADEIERLLAFADTAMYEAKRSESNVMVYSPSMTQRLIKRRALEDQLALALEYGEFSLVYQPQVDVVSNSLKGFEALLRWNRDGTWVPPNDFIGPLESTREIRAVGRWVMIEACKQAAEWNRLGHDVCISVNVSSVQFQDPRMLDVVLEALEISGIDPVRLDLEITESLLLTDVELTSKTLFELRDLGVSVSIDDFGTGYSSLSYLQQLPLTRLKIDRAFIKGIPNDDDGMIAQTIIDLSHNLKLSVLAEGVETAEQLAFLKRHACEQYQGFLFSRPCTVEQCNERLASDWRRGGVRSRSLLQHA